MTSVKKQKAQLMHRSDGKTIDHYAGRNSVQDVIMRGALAASIVLYGHGRGNAIRRGASNE